MRGKVWGSDNRGGSGCCWLLTKRPHPGTGPDNCRQQMLATVGDVAKAAGGRLGFARTGKDLKGSSNRRRGSGIEEELEIGNRTGRMRLREAAAHSSGLPGAEASLDGERISRLEESQQLAIPK